LKRVGQDSDRAFQVNNALSPDLQYYRLSLVPSLLEKVHPNIKAGITEFGIFEMGKIHRKDAIEEDGLPSEFDRLGIVYTSNSKKEGAAYFYARTILDYLADGIGLTILVEPLGEPSDDQDMPFDAQRSAHIIDRKSGTIIGTIGEMQASVRKSLKLPEFTAAIELDVSALVQCADRASVYQPLSKYPAVDQDICLKVKSTLNYQELSDFLALQLQLLVPKRTLHSLVAQDIYQRPEELEFKQITYRLHIASYLKTLTDKEVNQLLESLAVAAGKAFGAVRI
jgi:phenylalanyl-tRNA synthetase beta chain